MVLAKQAAGTLKLLIWPCMRMYLFALEAGTLMQSSTPQRHGDHRSSCTSLRIKTMPLKNVILQRCDSGPLSKWAKPSKHWHQQAIVNLLWGWGLLQQDVGQRVARCTMHTVASRSLAFGYFELFL